MLIEPPPVPPERKQNGSLQVPARAPGNTTCVTVLCRPTSPNKSSFSASRFDIGEELKHIKGLQAIHVSPRLNVASLDTEAALLFTEAAQLFSQGVSFAHSVA